MRSGYDGMRAALPSPVRREAYAGRYAAPDSQTNRRTFPGCIDKSRENVV